MIHSEIETHHFFVAHEMSMSDGRWCWRDSIWCIIAYRDDTERENLC